ncbi:hypothetical protein EV127DRAFT_476878 [Xylaria flabelliformis]|nr:hypothetical protein EV127DRAFT_476878 [Xylaria flabelliformis]
MASPATFDAMKKLFMGIIWLGLYPHGNALSTSDSSFFVLEVPQLVSEDPELDSLLFFSPELQRLDSRIRWQPVPDLTMPLAPRGSLVKLM